MSSHMAEKMAPKGVLHLAQRGMVSSRVRWEKCQWCVVTGPARNGVISREVGKVSMVCCT